MGSTQMLQGFPYFPTWEDGFLAIAVPVFLALAGAGLAAAWLNRRKE